MEWLKGSRLEFASLFSTAPLAERGSSLQSKQPCRTALECMAEGSLCGRHTPCLVETMLIDHAGAQRKWMPKYRPECLLTELILDGREPQGVAPPPLITSHPTRASKKNPNSIAQPSNFICIYDSHPAAAIRTSLTGTRTIPCLGLGWSHCGKGAHQDSFLVALIADPLCL